MMYEWQDVAYDHNKARLFNEEKVQMKALASLWIYKQQSEHSRLQNE